MRGGKGGEGGRGNRGGMGMVVRVYKFRYKIFSRRYRKNIIISLRYRSEIATSYQTAFKLLYLTYRLCSTPYPSGVVTRSSRLLVNLP